MIITADHLHDGKKFLLPGTAVSFTEEGMINGIYEGYVGNAVHVNGMVCPGFVNVHCHLELSHLKGFIPKHTGLIPFLLQVIKGRSNFTDDEKAIARKNAYETLWRNGVSAVGDISNTTDCLDIRTLRKMYVHSFVEAVGFNDAIAEKSFEYALKVYRTYQQQSIPNMMGQSIVPHAPYSVSRKLFRLLSEYEPNSIISIHNQETQEEDLFYQDGLGQVNDLLNGLGIDYSAFQPSGRSSLKTYTDWLAATHPMILVHDSFTRREDVFYVLNKFSNLFFCLCPNANLYIENTLPDVEMLLELDVPLCIGTDSLASNDALCVYSELNTLHKQFNIPWEQLLQWGCYNGARALQIQDQFGSFEVGRTPGAVSIHDGVATRLI